MSEEEYYSSKGITGSRSRFESPRGISLFTRSWLPLSSPPSALICMIHGYGNDISWTFQNTAIFFAQLGYAAVALDLPGHGQSDGLKAFVPNVDDVITDCRAFFDSLLPAYQNLPRFLFGESMGAAICLLIHLAEASRSSWNGAVLVAPMCRISDELKPSWPVVKILTALAAFAPTLPIVPTEDLIDKAVRVPSKRAVGRNNPHRYTGKPRLGTVLELLRVTEYVGRRLPDVELPFIVVHGDGDVVTDPSVSRDLYEMARSEDKTMKIYEGMWHSLLYGETDENIEIVRKDIADWLAKRISKESL